MAPAQSAPVHRPKSVNGHHNPEHSATQALAARLAPALSQNGDHRDFDRESFGQLLKTCLESNGEGQTNVDEDIEANYQLICVVFKAAFGNGSNGSPFASRSLDEEQVVDSLKVIELAFKKVPTVLYRTSGSEELGDGNDGVPLFMWLFPKLLSLLGDWQSPLIKETVFRLISTSIDVEARRSQYRCLSGPILRFAHDYAAENLAMAERKHVVNKQHYVSSEMSVPESRHFFATVLRRMDLPESAYMPNFAWTGFRVAIPLSLRLMSIVGVATLDLSKIPGRLMAARPILYSVVTQLHRCWKVIWKWLDEIRPCEEAALDSARLFLEHLQTLCSRSMSSRRERTFSRQIGLLRIQCLSQLCRMGSLEDEFTLQLHCMESLRVLRQAVVDSVDMRDGVENILLPALTSLRPLHALSEEFRIVISDFFEQSFLEKLQSTNRRDSKERSLFSTTLDSPIAIESKAHEERHDEGRPRKRQRLSNEHEDTVKPALFGALVGEVHSLLGTHAAPDLEGLSGVATRAFKTLSEDKQCGLMTTFGRLACVCADTVTEIQHGPVSKSHMFQCSICDSSDDGRADGRARHHEQLDELFKTLHALIPALQKTSRIRIAAMLALRRMVAHSMNEEHFQIPHSHAGEWCLSSLRSSSRELRLAASHTLMAFLDRRHGDEASKRNRVVALDFLQTLLNRNEPPTQETSILALSRIAQTSEEEELNIILVRFIELLGYPNPYIDALVYNELQKIAQANKKSPWALFSPYWRTLSIPIIRNLQSRPDMAQKVCDLMNIKVADLLTLTKVHTLPYLVLTRKQDIIARIAAADDSSPGTLCRERHTLAAVLAYLLGQPSADPEGMIMSLLLDVSEDFKDYDVAHWLRTEPMLISCHLLTAIVDAGDGRASRVHQGLHLLASLVKGSGHVSSTKKNEIVGSFIESHVLGIITEFAHTITDFQIKQPIIEKRRCLGAIGEMIKIAKDHVRPALPQICGCLRTAIEDESLCDRAFGAWATLIASLSEEYIKPLIDQTMAIVVRSWELFRTETQEQAHSLIGHILNNHASAVRELIGTLPSLGSIPVMSKYESELGKLKAQFDVKHQFLAFSQRCQSDNLALVEQSLRELVLYLEKNQDFVHQSVLSEQPDPVVGQLARSLLDCCVNLGPQSDAVANSCGQSIGLLGCLDPNRTEFIKEKKDVLVLQNFAKADETVDFLLFFLQHVLVKAFLSASNSRSQGFVAWAMQELLNLCNLDSGTHPPTRNGELNARYRRWLEVEEANRNILSPFLTSRYTISVGAFVTTCSYPLFTTEMSHGEWLRTVVLDMLQKGPGENVELIYFVCSRIIRYQDASISSFLLPFVSLNLIIAGTEKQKEDLVNEILNILDTAFSEDSRANESVRLCSESIFEILDYLSRWLQEKKKLVHAAVTHSNRASVDSFTEKYQYHISSVEQVLQSIPSGDISRRALECKSYARALFYCEREIRERRKSDPRHFEENKDHLLGYLQEIYTHIDEPDGIEGISTQLNVLNINQQVLEHRKTGRWDAAQSWYGIQLRKSPSDVDLQVNLLSCLKEAGQYDTLLTQFDGLSVGPTSLQRLLPFAAEASWVSEQWDKMRSLVHMGRNTSTGNFNLGMAAILDFLRRGETTRSLVALRELRLTTARAFTTTNTASLQACHDQSLQLHVLAEITSIIRTGDVPSSERKEFFEMMDRRLDILGVHLVDKQYLLGLRRATMQLSGRYSDFDVASAWLTSARLARKGNSLNEAFSAVLHATQLGDKSATIEHARLIWKDGHHRKAIQSLEGAIKDDLFVSHNFVPEDGPTTLTSEQQQQQNMVTARAHLLLAKWLDAAGQTQSEVIIEKYRMATNLYTKWDKAHYYLGRHYNKILDSEKAKAPGKEAQTYLSGEIAKLVIGCYLRSLISGTKYVFQTMPKVLTLWIELTTTAEQSLDPRRGNNEKFQAHNMAQKKKVVEDVHSNVKRYVDNRLSPAVLYTILPQVVARICHTNATVYGILTAIVLKVVRAFPQQALWSLLAVVKSSSRDRATRGLNCMSKLAEFNNKKAAKEPAQVELKALLTQGQKLSDELLRVCEHHIEGKPSRLSLSRDLGFNHKTTPCRLVIPLESALTPSISANGDASALKTSRAFPKDAVTISTFLDDVLVLASLQKPRKLSVRGSDGKIYSLLCKPKDDLRKDQRLMEFNTMINRFMKRDVESSKRRLYIKTYAVTPLNEECGLIEWVDGLKTFRDILLRIYKEKGIQPNYNEIRSLLEEACNYPSKLHLFNDKVVSTFPPVFHEWFVEMFPSPGAWFQARLKYTQSCAVMSMTGHVLGLGDRHGENILFEEGDGGTLHVDFNCLFDKGRTFEKPELVPFRLTHNMVDAFGAYGYNGPFRRSCELSLGLLRQNEDALMTILETFLYDPTTDFIGKKKRSNPLVPETPEGVLESVRNKLRGLLPFESVPLSVGGYVEHLITQATDPKNLAAMYIGWCAFF